jgi:hypothetical protein
MTFQLYIHRPNDISSVQVSGICLLWPKGYEAKLRYTGTYLIILFKLSCFNMFVFKMYIQRIQKIFEESFGDFFNRDHRAEAFIVNNWGL